MEYFKDLRRDLTVVLLLCICVSLLVAGLALPHWQETLILSAAGIVAALFLVRRTVARTHELRRQASIRNPEDGPKQE